MLMLEIYFDETGHGDDPNINFFGIVGCLAKADDWAEFKSEWEAVLKAEGLGYFHMNEFAHSKKIFKDWKGDKQRRAKLEDELWKIINKLEPVVIGCFVDLEGYRGQLGKVCRDTIGDVYYLCYLHCIKVILTLVANESMSNFSISNIATIFDDKKGFIGKATNIYKDIMDRFPELSEKIPPPIFRDMRKVNPIQVADIIAYEAHKEFKEQAKGINRAKKRLGFERLEVLMVGQTNRNSYVFGDTRSPFAFYSQYELARINVDYEKQSGNKNLQ